MSKVHLARAIHIAFRSLLLISVVVGACAPMVSGGGERGRRKYYDEKERSNIYVNKPVDEYVAGVAKKVASISGTTNVTTVSIVRNLKAPVAYPGGFIFIPQWYLIKLNSEDELAATIAHELAHVVLRHDLDAYYRQSLLQLIEGVAIALPPVFADDAIDYMGFSLSNYELYLELEADNFAVNRLRELGYSVEAMRRILEAFAKPAPCSDINKCSSMRSYGARLAALGEIRDLTDGYRNALSSERFINGISGTEYRGAGFYGVISGGQIYDPANGYVSTLLGVWEPKIENSAIVLVNSTGDAKIYVERKLVSDFFAAQGVELLRYHEKNWGWSKLKWRDGVSSSENLSAIFGGRCPWSKEVEGGGVGGGIVWGAEVVLVRVCSSNIFVNSDDIVSLYLRDMRQLSAKSSVVLSRSVMPYRVLDGDSFAGIANRERLGESGERILRNLNRFSSTGEPVPGDLIKVLTTD